MGKAKNLSFEEKTYQYARQWAQSRRDFLKTGAAVFGSAIAAS
ncbi:MAG: twin-arginine translocation signal domain-containing protein, partial [Phycisphaerae bacterium]|nr:twin-arginine translocation signal domain-containing protein [Phycisphaerae bacterium]